MTAKDRVISALTQHDTRNSTRRGYNPNALPQYLLAADAAFEKVEKTACAPEEALHSFFCDRLLDICLKAL